MEYSLFGNKIDYLQLKEKLIADDIFVPIFICLQRYRHGIQLMMAHIFYAFLYNLQ